jgi:hypothetical protein
MWQAKRKALPTLIWERAPRIIKTFNSSFGYHLSLSPLWQGEAGLRAEGRNLGSIHP